MSDDRVAALLDDLERERQRLEALLAAVPIAGERAELKAGIIALFRRTDGLQRELELLRERIRGLVERYKQLPPDASTREPARAPSPPPIRADHLGASTFIDKGWSLIALGDHAGAIEALTRALELAPDAIEARSLLGWAEMIAERHDQALATFSEVLAREPTNALARVNVGFICLRKGIFGEAIEHLSRVIRLDNDRKATLYAHYYLGLVYLERGMHLDAQTFLAKALALGPNLIQAYYDLGRAQWFGGDPDGARLTWRKGAVANRFAPWSKRCQELLDAVERGEPVPVSSSAG